MNTLRLSAWLGIVLGVVGSGLKVVRVLRQAEWWPFFVYDYIAAALLIAGGVAVLRGVGRGRTLTAGWGFGVAMTYGSYFGHLEKWMHGQGDLAFEHSMVVAVGTLLAVNTIGLALSLWPAGRAAVAAQPAAA